MSQVLEDRRVSVNVAPRKFSTALVATAIVVGSISVPNAAFASNVRGNDTRYAGVVGVGSQTRMSTGAQFVGSVASREEAAMLRLRQKGATFVRLADLLENRAEIASDLGYSPVDFEVFTHTERVLNQTKKSTDQIRIGLSDGGGLELRLRSRAGLYVAVINPDSTVLELHSGSVHQRLKAGPLPDDEIAQFFEEKM